MKRVFKDIIVRFVNEKPRVFKGCKGFIYDKDTDMFVMELKGDNSVFIPRVNVLSIGEEYIK